jgi:hypothetical protein
MACLGDTNSVGLKSVAKGRQRSHDDDILVFDLETKY